MADFYLANRHLFDDPKDLTYSRQLDYYDSLIFNNQKQQIQQIQSGNDVSKKNLFNNRHFQDHLDDHNIFKNRNYNKQSNLNIKKNQNSNFHQYLQNQDKLFGKQAGLYKQDKQYGTYLNKQLAQSQTNSLFQDPLQIPLFQQIMNSSSHNYQEMNDSNKQQIFQSQHAKKLQKQNYSYNKLPRFQNKIQSNSKYNIFPQTSDNVINQQQNFQKNQNQTNEYRDRKQIQQLEQDQQNNFHRKKINLHGEQPSQSISKRKQEQEQQKIIEQENQYRQQIDNKSKQFINYNTLSTLDKEKQLAKQYFNANNTYNIQNNNNQNINNIIPKITNNEKLENDQYFQQQSKKIQTNISNLSAKQRRKQSQQNLEQRRKDLSTLLQSEQQAYYY